MDDADFSFRKILFLLRIYSVKFQERENFVSLRKIKTKAGLLNESVEHLILYQI